MHRCGHRGSQEKCPAYLPKNDKPGNVDLTCIWLRKHFWMDDGDYGDICTKAIQKDATGVYE